MLRVAGSNPFTPRSQSTTFELPWATMYSALISRSLIVALMPRLSSTGLSVLPTSVSSTKFCMLRAPSWIMSAYSADQLDVPRVDRLGHDRQAVAVADVAENLQPLFAQSLERVGAGPRLERPAAEDVGAGLANRPPAIASIRSGASTAHGPAIIPR